MKNIIFALVFIFASSAFAESYTEIARCSDAEVESSDDSFIQLPLTVNVSIQGAVESNIGLLVVTTTWSKEVASDDGSVGTENTFVTAVEEVKVELQEAGSYLVTPIESEDELEGESLLSGINVENIRIPVLGEEAFQVFNSDGVAVLNCVADTL